MSLQLKANITTPDCLNLIFNETTGVYSTSNLTGYGTPNPLITAATNATLSVITPSAAYFFPLFSSGFPSFNTNSSYSISSTSLGFSNGLEDGLYQFVYTVTITITGVPTIFTLTQNFYITCNLQCCIDRMLLNLDSSECDSCNEEETDKYIKAFGILQQIYHAIECGDLTTASNLSNLGNKLCKNINCSTCK